MPSTGAASSKAGDGAQEASVSWAQLQPGEQPAIGVRIYSDGINPTKPQNFFVRLIAQVTLALYTGERSATSVCVTGVVLRLRIISAVYA